MRVKKIIVVALAGFVLAACSKKEETSGAAESTEAPVDAAAAPENAAAAAPPPATAPTSGIETMPGENAVRSALAAKDYNTAVTKLIAMKANIPTEMWQQYGDFYAEVRNVLAEDAQTSPQAAQALIMLRAATAGR